MRRGDSPGGSCQGGRVQPAELPNILLITTDQQRTDTLGCYGAGWMRTPNLDQLAEEGVLFERAYSVSPLCTPSRVSLFTGQYPSRHGAWNVGCNARDDGAFVSHSLGAAGYRTHHIGKAHWQANLAPADRSVEAIHDNTRFPDWRGPYFGFESVEISIGHNGYNLIAGHHAEWVRKRSQGRTQFAWSSRGNRAFGAGAIDWGMPVDWHASVWTADRAIAFLESHNRSRPFFLHLGFQDPHHPHAVPEDFPDRVDPFSVPMPNFEEGELDRFPGHYLASREGRLESYPLRGQFPMAGQGEGFDYRGIPDRDVREARAYYYTLCQLIDREVGRVLFKLDESGLADNTLVLFTSDHGELLGDHGLWMKGCFPYDEVLRVPLVARWPAGLPSGLLVDAPMSLVDIVPTMLAGAGLDSSGRDGVNWMPFLQGTSKSPPRNRAFAEHLDDPEGIGFRSIVENAGIFTFWQDGKTSPDLSPSRQRELSNLLAREFKHNLRLPRLAYS